MSALQCYCLHVYCSYNTAVMNSVCLKLLAEVDTLSSLDVPIEGLSLMCKHLTAATARPHSDRHLRKWGALITQQIPDIQSVMYRMTCC